VPFFLAQGIFIWTYYVYVFRFVWTLYIEDHYITATIYVIIFHVFFGICQVCFLRTTFTEPGGIPNGFPEQYQRKDFTSSFSSGTGIDIEAGSHTGVVTETNKEGQPRRCDKCSKIKPDRCHHCSQCKRCVLKMDHHCPWVNNCVGFHNYKFFVLFLTWTCITGYYVSFCFLRAMIKLFLQGNPNTDIYLIVTFILCAVFAFGLSLFAGTHYFYTARNVTTIEVLEKSIRSRDNPYDLGVKTNFKQVFGMNSMLWFFPVGNSQGDGLSFQRKPTTESKSLLPQTADE